jgi:hypothetical protein
VPSLEDDFGQEAAEYLSECLLSSSKQYRAMIEERDASGGKSKGQGTGNVLIVTLVDAETESSINATMLEVCATDYLDDTYNCLLVHNLRSCFGEHPYCSWFKEK